MITTHIYVDSWRLYEKLLSKARADGWIEIASEYYSYHWDWREFGHDGLHEDTTLVIKMVCKDTEAHKQISLDHPILS